MKRIVIFFISVLFILSCNTSKRYLEKRQYDLAVRHTVKKLSRNPDKPKEILVLEEAYPKANAINQERISVLHSEGKPERWDEIFQIYVTLKDRQTLVEKVTPLKIDGRTVKFEHVDYDKLIKESKTKAAAYYYTHAKKLMDENYKESYRQAYEEFSSAKEYTNIYKDVDSLMTVCQTKGTIYALLVAVNKSPIKMPDPFLINILEQNTSHINSFWVKYDTKNEGKTYDYNVNIIIKKIDVSPDMISERSYVESTKIRDGWENVLDENGKVKKDSLGNEIKVEKYTTVSCTVIESRQNKSAMISGEVEYYENTSKEVTLVRDFKAEHVFENFFAIASGNLAALSSESKIKTLQKAIPYPTEQEMLGATNATLKDVIANLLKDNSTNLLMKF